MMEKIIWGENFSVGVEEINRQHKQLIGMINQMLVMDGMPFDSETVTETLTRMTNYADYHFTSEEKLMRDWDYPETAAHHIEHAAFMRKTAEFSMSAIAYKETVQAEMLEYLKTWLVEHIMISDMKYKNFFEKKGII